MKIYISGKIGEETISDATRQKFARAEEALKAKGYEVFNPTNPAWGRALRRGYETQSFEPGGTPVNAFPFYDYCLLRDLMVLSTKDAIFLLEDWSKSPGAKTEYDAAKAMKKRVCFQKESQARNELVFQWFEENETSEMEDHEVATLAEEYVEQHLHEVWLPID